MNDKPSSYDPNPSVLRNMYANLAKAAGIYAFAFGLLYFGYSEKWALPIVVVVIACVIWGGTYVAEACSGLGGNRLQ